MIMIMVFIVKASDLKLILDTNNHKFANLIAESIKDKLVEISKEVGISKNFDDNTISFRINLVTTDKEEIEKAKGHIESLNSESALLRGLGG